VRESKNLCRGKGDKTGNVKVIRLHDQTVTVKALFDAIELFRQNKIRNLAMIYDFENRGEPLLGYVYAGEDRLTAIIGLVERLKHMIQLDLDARQDK